MIPDTIIWGGVVERVQLQRKRDHGETLLGTTDNSIGQQRHTPFCSLEYARSISIPAMFVYGHRVVLGAFKGVLRGKTWLFSGRK